LSLEITLIDDKARPDSGEQFVLGDHPVRILDQNDQQVERTSADVNRCFTLEQEMRRGPKTKRPKPEHALIRRGTRILRLQPSAPEFERAAPVVVKSHVQLLARSHSTAEMAGFMRCSA